MTFSTSETFEKARSFNCTVADAAALAMMAIRVTGVVIDSKSPDKLRAAIEKMKLRWVDHLPNNMTGISRNEVQARKFFARALGRATTRAIENAAIYDAANEATGADSGMDARL